MKSLKFISVFISFFFESLLSNAQNESIKVDFQSTIATNLLTKAIFTDNNKLKTFIDSKINSIADTDIQSFYNDNLNDKAIIIIKHQFNYVDDPANPGTLIMSIEDANKDDIIILHKDKNIKGTSQWTDYILNVKHILLVFIGGDADLQSATIKIKKQKSFFRQNVTDFANFVTKVGGLGGGLSSAPATMPIRYVVINEDKLNSPCAIQIFHAKKESPIEINIHEKNYFSINIGVSGQQLNKNQIKLQNQQLAVSLDSTQKKEWKSNLVAMINIYPFGRDIDRFEPFYKQNLKGKKFSHKLYKLTLERIGIFVGARLSLDPIQNLYLGGTYAFSKNFNFIAGYTWVNNLTPSITNVGNINSVKDALEYADRKYERQVFFGVSFAPNAIGEILGINKDDTKK